MGYMDLSKALCRTIFQDCNPGTMNTLDDSSLAGAMEAWADLASAEEDYHEQEFVQATRGVPQGYESSSRICEVQLRCPGHGVHVLASCRHAKRQLFFHPLGPCVLRPVKTEGTDWYIFYGEAFVKGQMDGEALDL